MIRHRIKEVLISFKNPGFEQEAEWRIVSTIHKASKKIGFRNGKFGITPFIKLNLSRRTELPDLKLPITSIWAGPRSPIKANAQGLEMLCESKELLVQIKYSTIEYR